MKQALQHIREQVPFFSAGQLLLSEGHPYPEAMGGNCILQSKKLIEYLQRKGVKTRVHKALARSSTRGHRIVIATENERDFVLDPLIYTPEPIDLTAVREEKQEVVITPDLNLHGSTANIYLAPITNKRFSLGYNSFQGTDPRKRQRLRARYDIFDQSNPSELPPIDDKKVGHLYKNKIVFEIVDPETKELLSIKLEVESDEFIARIIGKEKHPVNTPGFDKIIARISEITGVNKAEILDTMLRAKQIQIAISGISAPINTVIQRIFNIE